MSSSRMAPLWRSSGRCLAIRPRAKATTTTLPRSMTASVSSGPARSELAARRSVAAFPAAVRGYADDATTRDNEPASHATETAEAISSQTQPSQTAGAGSGVEAADKAKMSAAKREAIRQLELLTRGLPPFDPFYDGHKFGLTTAATRASTTNLAAEDEDADLLADGEALPRVGKVQERYDPVMAQLTRLMMRDGKLAKAQRDMAVVLNYLRTAPPPKLDAAHPLLPGHPPAAELPLDPVRYLGLVIDSVAPLIRIQNLIGQAGGGRALPVPMPLAERQRRRTAFVWLLEIVNKKQSRGSGRNMFAHRVAEEIVAVAEGRSNLWEKRRLLHRMGTAARINVNALTQKRKHK